MIFENLNTGREEVRMTKCLIMNADGYGFTRGINRGIEEAVARGMITSISVNAISRPRKICRAS